MKQQRYIEKEYIQQFLPDNPIIIEAGGHIGRDAIQMSKIWPNGHVYTFEPVPDLYKKLTVNIARYANITAYNVALSDTTGTQIMHISDEQCDAVSSLLAPKEFAQKRPEVAFAKVKVPTITIDDWAQQNNIPRVDFMWLDLQGHELAVLKSAQTILPTVKVIHTEVSLTERYAGNPLYDEVRIWIEAQGFIVESEALYRKTWGNILFIRP